MSTEAGVWSSMRMPEHPDGTVDGRYTLCTEWTGFPRPQWVGRFCGVRIASGFDEFAVSLAITGHARERREALRGVGLDGNTMIEFAE